MAAELLLGSSSLDFPLHNSTALSLNLGLIDEMGGQGPFSHNAEKKNVHHLFSSNGGLRDEPALAPSADMSNFVFIGQSFLRRTAVARMLRKLCVQLSVISAASMKQTRKRKLFAELMANINNYSASLAKAKEVIEQKKKHLTGAIRTAKELKFSRSVIYDLKLPVEAELSKVKNLNGKILKSLFLNSYKITSSLEDLGKIKQGMTLNEDNGQDMFVLDDQEEMPDVIIEEILEDDLEGKFPNT
ncbi:hypothetical protein WISP_14823 [Willisornis vidua]|uniref:Uncharacterized protein n=1 Tax=Willisornis vidua TaxID=1566151 RepID=A0ABQ9DVK3_9PASS|nr:hypothetical protein WISP_14823 [Willisornis vidua]